MLSHLGIENDIAIKLELRNVQGEMQLKIKFFLKKSTNLNTRDNLDSLRTKTPTTPPPPKQKKLKP
jgi:hypothetical protein